MAGYIPLNYSYPPEPTAGDHPHPNPPKYLGQTKTTKVSDEEKTVPGKYQRMEKSGC